MFLEVDGHQIYANTGGREMVSGRQSVLFVHGSGLDHTVWTLPSRHFVRHGLNVLSIDLPGHGRSGGAAPASIGAMADAVIKTIDAAGVEQTALVGHSMGSLVVLDAAGRYPDRVRSLALLGTSVPMLVADPLLDAAQANDHAAIEMLTIWGYSKRAQIGGNHTPGMWMVGSTMRLFERSGPGVLHTDLNACHTYTTGLDAARQVACPTLLIVGSDDVMTPPVRANEVAEVVENVRTITLPGTGHTMMSEQPDAVLDALRNIVL